jgi:ribosomal-protein-alanine N-acetyltransferase
MLRRIKKEDIDSIIKIEEDTLNTTLGKEMLEDIISNPIMNAYVYDDNGVLGYISTSFDGITLEILNYCVASNHQNKNIGKKLLEYAINEAVKAGGKTVFLEVRQDNKRAIHIYESFGFKLIHIRKNYYKDSCDALVYEKVL